MRQVRDPKHFCCRAANAPQVAWPHRKKGWIPTTGLVSAETW